MDIETDSGVVQVDTEGEGPELLLIHSLLTGAEAFDAVVPDLAARRTVRRVSLPGFGSSTPLEGDITVYDLADRIAAAMDAIGSAPGTAVLGNGLGAFVAVALAARHGHRLGSLIPANGGAAFTPERAVAFETMRRLVNEGGMEAVVDVAVRRIFPEPYLEAHPEVIAGRRSVLVATHPGSFAAACGALAAMDLRPDLAGITNPTLVIAGAADQTTPPEMSAELAAGIPGAKLEVMPDCGHCPQLQAPQALVSTVTGFLASVAA